MAIARHNFNGINWGIETEGLPYKKLSDLEVGKVYPLFGCFVTPDHGYGEGAVLITEGALVNIPGRYVETVLAIRSSKEDVQDIKDGKCGFHYEKFMHPKYKRESYSLAFDELK